MNKRFFSMMALALGLAVPDFAQAPPVLTNSITQIAISNGSVGQITLQSGGTGYTSVPSVILTGGGGTGAEAVATIDATSGDVTSVSIVLGHAGTGYINAPTVSFSGGGTGTPAPSGAQATAFLQITNSFSSPFQNEVYGPAGDPIIIVSLAVGTEPASGFTYKLTVDGQNIGETAPPAPPGTPAGGGFDPPLPGIYNITSTTNDGNGNTAVSAVVRYFATGTAIVSPEAGGTPPANGGQGGAGPGTLVPVGSSLVIQATSTPQDGFVSHIDFYTDWNGVSGALIGSASNYPYSIIYTPAGPSGAVHVVKALAYDNNGVLVPASSSLDQITLTMTTANPSALPTCTIVTPATASLVQIPDYVQNSQAAIPIIVTAGASAGAQISRVELYINGVLLATDNAYPYTFNWQPTVTGVFQLTALAYDNLGNVIASTTSTAPTSTPAATIVTVEAAPAVAIISPGNGGILNSGAAASVTAVASDTNLSISGVPQTIQQVQFFQDGRFIGVASNPNTAGGDSYTVTFKPVQNTENGVVVPSDLTAIATDTLGFSGTSPTVEVTVTSGGTGGNVVIGTPPTSVLTAPINGANVIVNTPVTLSASGTAPNGNIASVAFLVDNAVVTTVTQYPYAFSYTFQNLGTYTVEAQVVDNVGDKTTSAVATVIVVPEPPPVVSVTAPTSGGIVQTGASVTVTANASTQSGTISQVEFFVNGISFGVATAAPYTETYTPLSAGLYTFTAIATDNAGETTTSTPVIVEAFPTSSGLGTTSYFGQYQGLTDGGKFAFIVVDGTFGTYIGYSNTGPKPVTTFYTDIPVSPGGSFSASGLSGIASQTGASGNLIPSQDLFIGSATQSGSVTVAQGYYTGNIQGVPGSQLTGILGADGEFMVYINSGSSSDVGYGNVDSTGAFTITTANNNSLTGKVSPSTGFLTGTISGASGGALIGARVSGGTFSDGVLKNISTRGQIGSGSNVMIAGFVVGGTANKQLLIRAVGPTLATSFSLPGAISGTQLQVFSGATLVSSNTGWSSTPANALAVSNAEAQVGAFALPSGSADSAIVGSFPPGNYTAMVSGAGGATGIGLVEAYDLDTFTPFTTMKLTNVSTRGNVGTGSNVLIGGFEINGTAPKRLLIRGAGPSLTSLNVSGALAAPHLLLFNSSQATIRENFAWQVGNDSAQLSAAEQATGAFAFANGSADSAILIVLPPGTYTAEVEGVGNTTGTALVEVYEVP